MAKFRNIKNSFVAGEISPTALARSDLPQYPNACKVLQNMIPLLSGGVYRRPGTFFEDNLDTTKFCGARVIPFVVSRDDAYAIVLGSKLDDNAATTGSGYVNFYKVTSNTDRSTLCTITGITTRTPYRLATVGNGHKLDDIFNVQFAQSADVLWLVHPLRAPTKFYRTASTTFLILQDLIETYQNLVTERDRYPYRSQNTTATTLSCSATSGVNKTLTASTAIFDPGHVGALFKINIGGVYGCVQVSAYTSPTSVKVTILTNLGSTGTSTTWWESAWSDYRGWPRGIVFHRNRLAYLGNASQPDTTWFSQTNNFDQMSADTIVDPANNAVGDQPFTFTLGSQQLNQLQWGSSGQTLVVGTLGAEWILDLIDTNTGFECGNVSATTQTAYGSDHQQAVRQGNEIMFRTGTEIRSLVFNQLQNAYTAEPVQLFYDQYPQLETKSIITTRQFRQMAWDGSRKTLWCIDSSGNLIGMTRDRSLQINAWHSHELGGWDDTDGIGGIEVTPSNYSTDPVQGLHSGSVVSIAVIPNPIYPIDDLWMVVRRKINGAFAYHLERMIGGICPFDSAYGGAVLVKTGAYYVDAAAYGLNEFPNPEDGVFQGDVTHLEGKILEGTAYGDTGLFPLDTTAVTAGVAPVVEYPPDFTSALFAVALGLPFTGILQPVKPDVGSQIGTAMGAMGRVHQVTAKLFKTMVMKIGQKLTSLQTIDFRTASTPMNQSAELFTGDRDVKIDHSYDRQGLTYIVADYPLPFAIIGIVAEGDTYD